MEQSSGRSWGQNEGKENTENPGPSDFPVCFAPKSRQLQV